MTSNTQTVESNTSEAQIARDALRDNLTRNIAARVAFESTKSDSHVANKLARQFNYNFNLERVMIHDDTLDAALACNVDSFDFINAHKRESDRFNVYALKRVARCISALANKHASLDATCACILANLEAKREMIESKRLVYTREHAFYMRSSSYSRNDSSVKRNDIKHRMNACSAGTATSQASAALRALEALRVFDLVNDVISNVNYEHALFKHVRA